MTDIGDIIFDSDVTLKVGDRVIVPALPPTRWERFKSWLTGKPRPETVEMVIIATSEDRKPPPD